MIVSALLHDYVPAAPPKVLAGIWERFSKLQSIGIDLGTTYSCVGVFNSNRGEVEIIPTKEGDKVIPSAIRFAPDGRVIIGRKAKEEVYAMPCSSVCRLLCFPTALYLMLRD